MANPPPRTPLVVACAVISDAHGHILAAQRPLGRSLGGKWEFPGGKVEPGETPAQALQRELQEELSIHAHIGPALPIVLHDYPEFTIELHPYHATILHGTPIPYEHTALRWITPAQASTLDWAAADLPILTELQ